MSRPATFGEAMKCLSEHGRKMPHAGYGALLLRVWEVIDQHFHKQHERVAALEARVKELQTADWFLDYNDTDIGFASLDNLVDCYRNDGMAEERRDIEIGGIREVWKRRCRIELPELIDDGSYKVIDLDTGEVIGEKSPIPLEAREVMSATATTPPVGPNMQAWDARHADVVAIHDFLDWCGENNLFIAERRDPYGDGMLARLDLPRETLGAILYRYVGVDPDALERERRAMIASSTTPPEPAKS